MRALLATLLIVALSACSFELPTDLELDTTSWDGPTCEQLGGCEWNFNPDSLAADPDSLG